MPATAQKPTAEVDSESTLVHDSRPELKRLRVLIYFEPGDPQPRFSLYNYSALGKILDVARPELAFFTDLDNFEIELVVDQGYQFYRDESTLPRLEWVHLHDLERPPLRGIQTFEEPCRCGNVRDHCILTWQESQQNSSIISLFVTDRTHQSPLWRVNLGIGYFPRVEKDRLAREMPSSSSSRAIEVRALESESEVKLPIEVSWRGEGFGYSIFDYQYDRRDEHRDESYAVPEDFHLDPSFLFNTGAEIKFILKAADKKKLVFKQQRWFDPCTLEEIRPPRQVRGFDISDEKIWLRWREGERGSTWAFSSWIFYAAKPCWEEGRVVVGDPTMAHRPPR